MPTDKKLELIELCIHAAEEHGKDSEPDHEVGDLQDCLRDMWDLLTPTQKAAFMALDGVRERIEFSLGADSFEEAAEDYEPVALETSTGVETPPPSP